MFPKIKKIHFVGIGGIGMSGIAEILINKGFQVSGSDNNASENTEHIQALGAKIFIGHNENNIKDAEVVVYSSAVNINTNPEIVAANQRNIPIIRRAEMLAEISRLNYCIAVAGTHGKTTSTSMLALILIEAGIDPTVVVGGRLKDMGGTNARLGNGDWTIVEADEYDRSFLQLTPAIAVINNIEAEHLDIYSDMDDLLDTFAKFANMTPFYGFISVGIDCEGVKQVMPKLRKKVITYGLVEGSDYQAKNIIYNKFSSICDVYEYGRLLGKITINVPGEFNIKNALSAISVARQLDIDFELIVSVISKFHGAYRRFDIIGEVNGAIIIDDYAHHPSEISATLKGATNYEGKRIIAAFQPHTFTRTRDFYIQFAKALKIADVVFVTDIYPAREAPIEGITGEIIVTAAKALGANNISYISDKEKLFDEIIKILKPNDIVITIGAGDIWKLSRKLGEFGKQ
jgi:UDP-N-acetylmuramate--alanine ligase